MKLEIQIGTNGPLGTGFITQIVIGNDNEYVSNSRHFDTFEEATTEAEAIKREFPGSQILDYTA